MNIFFGCKVGDGDDAGEGWIETDSTLATVVEKQKLKFLNYKSVTQN